MFIEKGRPLTSRPCCTYCIFSVKQVKLVLRALPVSVNHSWCSRIFCSVQQQYRTAIFLLRMWVMVFRFQRCLLHPISIDHLIPDISWGAERFHLSLCVRLRSFMFKWKENKQYPICLCHRSIKSETKQTQIFFIVFGLTGRTICLFLSSYKLECVLCV